MVYDWCIYNKLSLNPTKCSYMLITPKHVTEEPVLVLGGETVLRVTDFKYLGLFIDDSLKFHKQIDQLCIKMSRLCGVSHRLGHHLDYVSARNFYYSFVYSVLTYCVCIWGGILQCTARGAHLESL